MNDLIALGHVWEHELLFVVDEILLEWFESPQTHLTSWEQFWVQRDVIWVDWSRSTKFEDKKIHLILKRCYSNALTSKDTFRKWGDLFEFHLRVSLRAFNILGVYKYLTWVIFVFEVLWVLERTFEGQARYWKSRKIYLSVFGCFECWKAHLRDKANHFGSKWSLLKSNGGLSLTSYHISTLINLGLHSHVIVVPRRCP